MNICGASRLRIEEIDVAFVLPQILSLRALVEGHISLVSDAARWLDAHDAHAMHWGVFRDSELVAAARLRLVPSLGALPDAALFDSIGPGNFNTGAPGLVAIMSHRVVLPRRRDPLLGGMLDAARVERARQLRLGAVLAISRSERRTAELEAQGFDALDPSGDGRRGLVLSLAREPFTRMVRMRVPSRT